MRRVPNDASAATNLANLDASADDAWLQAIDNASATQAKSDAQAADTEQHALDAADATLGQGKRPPYPKWRNTQRAGNLRDARQGRFLKREQGRGRVGNGTKQSTTVSVGRSVTELPYWLMRGWPQTALSGMVTRQSASLFVRRQAPWGRRRLSSRVCIARFET